MHLLELAQTYLFQLKKLALLTEDSGVLSRYGGTPVAQRLRAHICVASLGCVVLLRSLLMSVLTVCGHLYLKFPAS